MKSFISNLHLQDEKEKDKEKEKEKEKADERVCKLRFVDKSFGARQKKTSSWQVLRDQFCLDGSDFCQSQGRFFWIFQQILEF